MSVSYDTFKVSSINSYPMLLTTKDGKKLHVEKNRPQNHTILFVVRSANDWPNLLNVRSSLLRFKRAQIQHLYSGAGRGYGYFWASDFDASRHGNYFHSKLCPCVTGKNPKWNWEDDPNGQPQYVPVGEGKALKKPILSFTEELEKMKKEPIPVIISPVPPTV